MTLVEVLASVVLLALIAIAAVGWMQSALRLSARDGDALVWYAAANAACRAIMHDLRTGDFTHDADARRVEIVSGALRVPTRGDDGQPTEFEYRLDGAAGALIRAERDGRAGANRRILLGLVQDVEFEMSQDEQELLINIRSTDGRSVQCEVMLW